MTHQIILQGITANVETFEMSPDKIAVNWTIDDKGATISFGSISTNMQITVPLKPILDDILNPTKEK